MSTRTLSHLELLDLKAAVDKATKAVPDLILALDSGETSESIGDLAAIIGALEVVRCNLQLDLVDEDPDDGEEPEPEGTIANLERITRGGGRVDA